MQVHTSFFLYFLFYVCCLSKGTTFLNYANKLLFFLLMYKAKGAKDQTFAPNWLRISQTTYLPTNRDLSPSVRHIGTQNTAKKVVIFLCLNLFTVFICLDESEELRDGFFLRNVFEDALFAAVKGNTVTTGSHIAVIGVRHLTRTVHYTAHDGYF